MSNTNEDDPPSEIPGDPPTPAPNLSVPANDSNGPPEPIAGSQSGGSSGLDPPPGPPPAPETVQQPLELPEMPQPPVQQTAAQPGVPTVQPKPPPAPETVQQPLELPEMPQPPVQQTAAQPGVPTGQPKPPAAAEYQSPTFQSAFDWSKGVMPHEVHKLERERYCLEARNIMLQKELKEMKRMKDRFYVQQDKDEMFMKKHREEIARLKKEHELEVAALNRIQETAYQKHMEEMKLLQEENQQLIENGELLDKLQLRVENKKYLQDMKLVKKENQELLEENAKLKAEITKQIENPQSKVENKTHREDMKLLKQEKERLLEENAILKLENKKQTADMKLVKRANKRLSKLELENKKLTKDKKKYTEEKKKYMEEKKLMKKENNRLLRVNSQSKAKLASLKEEIKLLKQQQKQTLSSIENTREIGDTEKKSLVNENEELKDEILNVALDEVEILNDAYDEVFGFKDKNKDVREKENLIGDNEKKSLSKENDELKDEILTFAFDEAFGLKDKNSNLTEKENEDKIDGEPSNSEDKQKKENNRRKRKRSRGNNSEDDVSPKRKYRVNAGLRAKQDAVWKQYYERLKEYKRIHGHCSVPGNLKKEDEYYTLGVWVTAQRSIKKAKDLQFANPEREKMLNEIGFTWSSETHDRKWQKHFEKLLEFKRIHGHCDVPKPSDRSIKDSLAVWVSTQRTNYKREQTKGNGRYMPPEREHMLNAIGFKWIAAKTVPLDWYTQFQRLLAFKAKHGHCRVPQRPKDWCEDMGNLGEWVLNQRKRYRQIKEKGITDDHLLTEKRIRLLESIGFEWCVRKRESSRAVWGDENDNPKSIVTGNEENIDGSAILDFSV